jgi:hypothetical protein
VIFTLKKNRDSHFSQIQKLRQAGVARACCGEGPREPPGISWSAGNTDVTKFVRPRLKSRELLLHIDVLCLGNMNFGGISTQHLGASTSQWSPVSSPANGYSNQHAASPAYNSYQGIHQAQSNFPNAVNVNSAPNQGTIVFGVLSQDRVSTSFV